MNPIQFLRLLLKGPTPQQMAAQLRQPHGFMARKVGQRMNAANRSLYEGAWKALDLRDGMSVLEIGFGNGLFFWDDPAAHLREVRRVLKPGGTFTAVLRRRSSMEKLPFAPYGFTMYEQADWEHVLRASGSHPIGTTVLKDAEVEYEGKKYPPESLVMTATPA